MHINNLHFAHSVPGSESASTFAFPNKNIYSWRSAAKIIIGQQGLRPKNASKPK